MNGGRTIMVEILNAIEHGTLSVDETRRRLEGLIDKEIQKTDAPANMQLVDECEKLLWELNTNGKIPFVSHLEENRAAVTGRIRKQQRAFSFLRNTLRIVAAAAAILILVIGTEVLLHKEWLNTTPTPDGEQLLITGETVDPGLVSEGIASVNEEDRELNTALLSEAMEFTDQHFRVLSSLSDNWNAIRYSGIKKGNRIRLITLYNKENRDPLTIDATWFPDVQEARLAFEQNREGDKVDRGGNDLYMASNMDRVVCMWIEGQSVYTLSGAVSTSEAMQVYDELYGG